MRQAYLSTTEESTVRVRIVDDLEAFVTIKTAHSGIARNEFEYAIPCRDARQLILLRQSESIEKTRHYIDGAGLVWEVDQFLGKNAGLVIAEVELDNEGSDIALPNWIGREITGQRQYRNSQLAKHPFGTWGGVEQSHVDSFVNPPRIGANVVVAQEDTAVSADEQLLVH